VNVSIIQFPTLANPDLLTPDELKAELHRAQAALLDAFMRIETMNTITQQIGAAMSKLLLLHMQGNVDALLAEFDRLKAAHVVVMSPTKGGMH
jgi:hypothetical protein